MVLNTAGKVKHGVDVASRVGNEGSEGGVVVAATSAVCCRVADEKLEEKEGNLQDKIEERTERDGSPMVEDQIAPTFALLMEVPIHSIASNDKTI